MFPSFYQLVCIFVSEYENDPNLYGHYNIGDIPHSPIIWDPDNKEPNPESGGGDI